MRAAFLLLVALIFLQAMQAAEADMAIASEEQTIGGTRSDAFLPTRSEFGFPSVADSIVPEHPKPKKEKSQKRWIASQRLELQQLAATEAAIRQARDKLKTHIAETVENRGKENQKTYDEIATIKSRINHVDRMEIHALNDMPGHGGKDDATGRASPSTELIASAVWSEDASTAVNSEAAKLKTFLTAAEKDLQEAMKNKQMVNQTALATRKKALSSAIGTVQKSIQTMVKTVQGAYTKFLAHHNRVMRILGHVYTKTDGKECGGTTIAKLEDGTLSGWPPGVGSIEACKAKCTRSEGCRAFEWNTSEKKCFWKKSVSLQKKTGLVCYSMDTGSAEVALAQTMPLTLSMEQLEKRMEPIFTMSQLQLTDTKSVAALNTEVDKLEKFYVDSTAKFNNATNSHLSGAKKDLGKAKDKAKQLEAIEKAFNEKKAELEKLKKDVSGFTSVIEQMRGRKRVCYAEQTKSQVSNLKYCITSGNSPDPPWKHETGMFDPMLCAHKTLAEGQAFFKYDPSTGECRYNTHNCKENGHEPSGSNAIKRFALSKCKLCLPKTPKKNMEWTMKLRPHWSMHNNEYNERQMASRTFSLTVDENGIIEGKVEGSTKVNAWGRLYEDEQFYMIVKTEIGQTMSGKAGGKQAMYWSFSGMLGVARDREAKIQASGDTAKCLGAVNPPDGKSRSATNDKNFPPFKPMGWKDTIKLAACTSTTTPMEWKYDSSSGQLQMMVGKKLMCLEYHPKWKKSYLMECSANSRQQCYKDQSNLPTSKKKWFCLATSDTWHVADATGQMQVVSPHELSYDTVNKHVSQYCMTTDSSSKTGQSVTDCARPVLNKKEDAEKRIQHLFDDATASPSLKNDAKLKAEIKKEWQRVPWALNIVRGLKEDLDHDAGKNRKQEWLFPATKGGSLSDAKLRVTGVFVTTSCEKATSHSRFSMTKSGDNNCRRGTFYMVQDNAVAEKNPLLISPSDTDKHDCAAPPTDTMLVGVDKKASATRAPQQHEVNPGTSASQPVSKVSCSHDKATNCVTLKKRGNCALGVIREHWCCATCTAGMVGEAVARLEQEPSAPSIEELKTALASVEEGSGQAEDASLAATKSNREALVHELPDTIRV